MNITAVYTSIFNRNYTYSPPYDEFGVILSASVLIPLCVFGVAANVITIYVIATSLKLRSTFNLLILSLSVSDLMSSLISPLFLYRRTWGFNIWVLSDFMCKITWAVDFWTNCVTSFHISIFAILRFASIALYKRYHEITPRHAKLIITAVWTVAFGVAFIPALIWCGAFTRDRSSNLPTSKWPSCSVDFNWVHVFKLYIQITYPLLFYFPILLVVLLSIGIAVKLHTANKARTSMKSGRQCSLNKSALCKRRRKERYIILQLLLIVGSFLMGYVPLTVYHLYTVSVPSLSDEQRAFDWWFGTLVYFSLRISECLNPIFYNVASSKMRRETKRALTKLLTKISCCRRENIPPVSSPVMMSTTAGPQTY